MNRYWDLTEKQRSELTGDQVRAFLDVELMEKGVARVAKPELQPVEEIALPTTTYFEINRRGEYGDQGTDLLFVTAEDAAAFIKLRPMWKESRWQYGSDRKYAEPGKEMAIKTINLPSEADVSNAAVVLKQNEAAEDANREAKEGYANAIKAVEDATKGVWDDWNECREKSSRCAKVQATREEYLKLCDGSTATAEAFLGKVFSQAEIDESNAWFAD
jgi:hypothetical protein